MDARNDISRDGKWISERLRSIESVTRPVFSAPPGACDCHMHIFGDAQTYSGVPDARYTLPEGSLGQYRAVADLLGLQRAVLVQPSYYGSDNSCLLDAMERFGRPCRGVIMLPESIDSNQIETWHRLGVRGIRLDFFKAEQAKRDRSAIVAELRRASDIARDAGWHVELYSPGHVTRNLFDCLAGLDVDFSVNHLGYMKADHGITDADFLQFVELARTRHCWVKLTGPYRVAPDSQKARTDWMAETLIAAAPEKVVWGTDWPHLPHGSRDTGELFNRLKEWSPAESGRNNILVRNPALLYQFDDSQ
jgi:2-pyrone-4,6-dicarboxylate lactonase